MQVAAEVLGRGGVVAYPTDTLYGLAVDPRSARAVAALFALKARQPGRAVPLIAGSPDQASAAAQFTPLAERLATRFWPGPLSIILRARSEIARGVAADDGSVAVRVPANLMAQELAQRFGYCITSTSANLSGDPPTASPDSVADALGDRLDCLLDGGEAPGGPPSTIVDARDAAPRLVRAGVVPWTRVLESLE